MYDHVFVGHVACVSVCMIEGYMHVRKERLFWFVSVCRLMLGLSGAEVLHLNQCFTKKRSFNLSISSKRAAFFSPVNSLNEIYRYEYILECIACKCFSALGH